MGWGRPGEARPQGLGREGKRWGHRGQAGATLAAGPGTGISGLGAGCCWHSRTPTLSAARGPPQEFTRQWGGRRRGLGGWRARTAPPPPAWAQVGALLASAFLRIRLQGPQPLPLPSSGPCSAPAPWEGAATPAASPGVFPASPGLIWQIGKLRHTWTLTSPLPEIGPGGRHLRDRAPSPSPGRCLQLQVVGSLVQSGVC